MSGRKNDSAGRSGRGRGRGRGRGARGRISARDGGRRSSSFRAKGRGGHRDPPSNATTSSSRTPPARNTATIKQNGEKGAESFTVSESERIRFTKILMELREGDETMLEFPPSLTNTERKFVHELAAQLGLVSKSSGKGENRRIVVRKRNETKKKTGDQESLPVLKVGRVGEQAMKEHLQRFPPSHLEDLESHETGAALIEALMKTSNDGDNTDAAVVETLSRLGIGGVAQQAAPIEVRNRHVDLERRKRYHEAAQKQKHSNPRQYEEMLRQRARLPAYSHQDEIVDVVQRNAVTIIQGETGSGKSTQVGQFLVDANPACNIVVTQPRRISAISIAERVAEEQCLNVGGTIGYQVRLESAQSEMTQLMFLTPGILLRKLQSSPSLSEYTHIIIDEIHERDRYTEFLLITLRDLLPQRPDLRLILMSATLQTQVLTTYFQDFNPAQVEMEGRTFPVQEFFLEDVLRMTGYIDASTAYDGGLAVNKDIEHELAKLAVKNQEEMLLTCSICGKSNFVDAIELGTHMALCDFGGVGQVETSNEESETIDETTNALAFASESPFFKDYDVSGSADIADFDDYDIDSSAEILTFGNFSIAKHTTKKVAVKEETEKAIEETNTDKWDGVAPFEIAQSTEKTDNNSVQDDVLLDQYQAMHDDDLVDYFLLMETLHYICKSSYGDGAILVFFPGWQEISEFTLMLETTAPFYNRSKYLILPLHSGIPSKDQRKVLQRPPQGVRKIILSTNIAETSLTIEDIAFVVDTGREKLKDYDPHLKTSTLQPTWISQASSKQRKGRAGRTKAGVCFHLFSRRRYESMVQFVESELLRTPLEEMCLICKKLALAPGGPNDSDGIPAFLSKAMSPPHAKAVSNALDLLEDLGAILPETNDLTTLGECLSVLSVEPKVGKMIIVSYLLGCCRTTSSMAVAMSYKTPFVLPPTSMRRAADNAKVQLSRGSESDQVTVFNALTQRDRLVKRSGSGALYSFCRSNFLSQSTLQMIADLRKNLARELQSLGFPSPPNVKQQYHNRHDNDQALWQAAIAAGLYPNVASRRRGDVNFSTMTNRKAKIHVSSVNACRGQPLSAKCEVPEGELEFVCFGEMIRGTRIFTMEQTTHLASPLPLLLLCGTSLSVMPENEENAILNVDDWIVFRCKAETAAHIVILRKRLESAFWNFISNPAAGLNNLEPVERDAVEIVGKVFQSAHRSAPTR